MKHGADLDKESLFGVLQIKLYVDPDKATDDDKLEEMSEKWDGICDEIEELIRLHVYLPNKPFDVVIRTER